MTPRNLARTLILSTLAACAGGENDPDQPDAGGPLYLVHSAVETPDTRLNYFTVVDDLEAGELSYDTSIEIPGRPRLYAAEGIGFFAIGDGEAVTITRYEVGDDGGLAAGETISFQSYGVTSMGAQAVLFVSPEKAYFRDATQGQVIVWNPTEMVIEGSVDLPADLFVADTYLGTSDWVQRDGEAYFAVGWTGPYYDQVLPGAALVRLDTTTDALTVTRDDRCRGLHTAREVDGTLYFFSDVINGFGHAVYPDEGGQQDCIVRILPGETTFDEGWLGTLADAAPDGTAAVAMDVTAEGDLWAQVVDLASAPSEPGATYSEWYASDWRWYRIPLDTLDSATPMVEAPGAYTSFTLAADSGFYVAQTEADYSATTLVDLSDGAPTDGLSFAGFVLDIARIR